MTQVLNKLRIGDALVAEGVITQEQLERVLADQKSSGRFLGEILVAEGMVTPAELVRVLAKQLNVKGCNLRTGMFDPAMLDLIGRDEALHLKALPMFRVHRTLTVAMAEPQSLPKIDRLRHLTGCEIRPVFALEARIIEFIKKISAHSADMDGAVASLAGQQSDGGKGILEDGEVTDLDEAAAENPVVNLVNMMLFKAVRDRASDIHIEPDQKGTRIRYRVDGLLRDMPQPPSGMHSSIISRVKVVGRMDIAEKRLPQEGRVRVVAEGRDIDLRVSSMPTVLGEKVVIRVLDRANLCVSMEELGFRSEPLEMFRRMLHQPYGLVLVTGPTGSGKTTTLYSALEQIKSPQRNIVTVEDPVEYQLDQINQIQVHESIGMTFASALRSILRQDPDVIMVGEVRDEETARVAVQAALTGHLVLATLHTNSAPGAVARLLDMNVASYLLASAINGVVAQRLVRGICSNCEAKYQPSKKLLRDAGLDEQKKCTFKHGAGCRECGKTGFSGRFGLYEVMEVNDRLRALIYEGASAQQLRLAWQDRGGTTLRQEGIIAAEAGRTTLEEAVSVTHSTDGVAESSGRDANCPDKN